MSREYTFIEYHNDDPVKVYKITLGKITEPGVYIQCISISGFTHRNQKRILDSKGMWYRKNAPLKRYSLEYSWELSKIFFYKDLPTETFTNLWDFYKHIGYDHKKNRFLDPDYNLQKRKKNGS